MIGADGTNGLTITNMTIDNQTPQGGSQAEALRLESCDKCVVTDATIISLQDTLLWDGRIYAKNCLIEGNVDYIWTVAPLTSTTADPHHRAERRDRAGPQPASTYGYVFVDSKITTDPGITGTTLARIDYNERPGQQRRLHQLPDVDGHRRSGGPSSPALTPRSSSLREYQSVDSSGNLTRRQPAQIRYAVDRDAGEQPARSERRAGRLAAAGGPTALLDPNGCRCSGRPSGPTWK